MKNNQVFAFANLPYPPRIYNYQRTNSPPIKQINFPTPRKWRIFHDECVK